MQRRSFVLLAMTATMTLVLLGAAPAAYCDSRWVAGVNYFVINPAQPTGLPAGKIQVTEIFSYACPGCNRFYPVADRLQASLPANAVMDYLPASFRPDEDWPMFQRAYFTAKEMGIDKRTHDALFDAVWKSGELAVFDPATQRAKRPAPTITDAARFYAQTAGVKPETSSRPPCRSQSKSGSGRPMSSSGTTASARRRASSSTASIDSIRSPPAVTSRPSSW